MKKKGAWHPTSSVGFGELAELEFEAAVRGGRGVEGDGAVVGVEGGEGVGVDFRCFKYSNLLGRIGAGRNANVCLEANDKLVNACCGEGYKWR